MPSRDTELFKEKIEVSLDGRQIFYLFFGGAVLASMVFVLGVMVGRRVEARSATDGIAASSPATDPLAALDQLEHSEAELAFPAALRGQAADLGSVDEELGVEVTRTDDEEPASEAAAKRAEPAPEPAPVAEKPKPEPEQKKPEPKKPEPAARKAERKPFTLQVGSFQDRGEAEAFHQELAAQGYDPYIAEVDLEDKGVWFRVRIGGYDSYDAAIAGKKKFESERHIIAYVTRLKK